MNQSPSRLFALGLAALVVLEPCSAAFGQAISHPNQIRGAIRFTNPPDSPVVRILGPFNRGKVHSRAVPPFDLVGSTLLTNIGLLEMPYIITVEALNPGDPATGVAYSVLPEMYLDGGDDTYYFRQRTSSPVLLEPNPDVILNFEECAGLLELHFVSPNESPVPVRGGSVSAVVLPENQTQAGNRSLRAGTTVEYLAVRGDADFEVHVAYLVGTDPYLDEVTYYTNLTVHIACGGKVQINCVISGQPTPGRIIGKVNMREEYELPVVAPFHTPPHQYTLMRAENGPYGSRRWYQLPGALSGMESSGAFDLTNLLPSSVTATPTSYQVWGEMYFRSNRWFQYFRTPHVPVHVPDIGGTNLGSLFEMTPGYLRGRIVLQGPACSSLLNHMAFPADADQNGLPDNLLYDSFVRSDGVNRLASGARHTAGGAVAFALFNGSFNPTASAFDGNYDLALAGVAGERSIWTRPQLSLRFVRIETASAPERFINSRILIHENTPAPQEIDLRPGLPTTNDLQYSFSEVKLRYRSTSGEFYSPHVRSGSTGGFSGVLEGRAADYSVDIVYALGTPSSLAAATNRGLVVMCLPAGTYLFRPAVETVNPGGGVSTTALQPIAYTVGSRQCIDVGQCLQLQVNAPECSSQSIVTVIGSVLTGCSNQVQSISYTLNDGPPQTICVGCGSNPSFTTAITLTRIGECDDNVLTVTATDDTGETSIVTSRIRFDNTAPVIIQCPSNIVVECQSPMGTVVNYTVTALDDCDPAPRLSCLPPSGTMFALGTASVYCTAEDACGNARTCGFTVTVRDTTPPVLLCPTNLVVECSGTNGTVVTFPVTATDNCETNIPVSCSLSSGTQFPVGETIVRCAAADSSQNFSECSFLVRVTPSRLTIERSITVRWGCGILQGADHINGPWTDIPGAANPYCVSSDQARRFYRTRN